jgi:hypothetical protein
LNTATISLSRSFGRTSLTLAAQRYDQWVDNEFYQSLQYNNYTYSITPAVALNDRFSVFWSNNYFINRLDDPSLQDSTGWSTAPGISGIITPNITGSLSAGWQHSILKATPTTPRDEIDGFYGSANLNYANSLRPYTTHSLSLFMSPGITGTLLNSSLQNVFGVTYTISHQLNRYIVLAPRVSYLRSDSLTGVKETRELISVGIDLSRSFGKHLSGNVYYVYQTEDSTIPGEDYDVNKLGAYITYWF